MNIFTGSELNRLARRFVDAKTKELRPSNRRASFADWQLIITDDRQKRLDIRYAVYESHKPDYIKGRRNKIQISIEFGSIPL